MRRSLGACQVQRRKDASGEVAAEPESGFRWSLGVEQRLRKQRRAASGGSRRKQSPSPVESAAAGSRLYVREEVQDAATGPGSLVNEAKFEPRDRPSVRRTIVLIRAGRKGPVATSPDISLRLNGRTVAGQVDRIIGSHIHSKTYRWPPQNHKRFQRINFFPDGHSADTEKRARSDFFNKLSYKLTVRPALPKVCC